MLRDRVKVLPLCRFTRKASRRRGMRSRSPAKDAGGDSTAQVSESL